MDIKINERSIKITFYGTVPSKKNSKQISYKYSNKPSKFYVKTKNGLKPIIPFLVASKAHQEFKKLRLPILKEYADKLGSAPYPKCVVKMLVYPGTKRKADLSNKFETLMDLCVDAGMIEDDNWFVCSQEYLTMIEIDRKNPRFELIIEPGVQ